MAKFIFIQAFLAGKPTKILYQPMRQLLLKYGKLGFGQGSEEFHHQSDEPAFQVGYLIGNEITGIGSLALLNPVMGDELSQLLFELIHTFDLVVYDDQLTLLYGTAQAIEQLPDALRQQIVLGTQVIQYGWQIWSAQVAKTIPAQSRFALRYKNPNANGPDYVMIDQGDAQKRQWYFEFDINPMACFPDNLTALENFILAIDQAQAENHYTQSEVFLRFKHHESSLRYLEHPKFSHNNCKKIILTNGVALLGDAAQQEQPDFCVSREAFQIAVYQVRQSLFPVMAQQYNCQLTVDLSGLAQLEQCLPSIEGTFQLSHADDSVPESILSWILRLGSYLGEVIRYEAGAQWGFINSIKLQIPCVKMHSGRIVAPYQLAMQLLTSKLNIQQFMADLMDGKRSKSAGTAHDVVSNIVGFCQILQGQARFQDGGLPCLAELNRQKLDFTLASLLHLDAYIENVHQCHQRDELDVTEQSNLVMAAGAYLGEVIRDVSDHQWQWQNLVDMELDLSNFGFSGAILKDVNHPQRGFYSPFNRVELAIEEGVEARSLLAFAQDLTGLQTDPPSKAIAQPSASQYPDLGQLDVAAAIKTLKAYQYSYLQVVVPAWLKGDSLYGQIKHMPILYKSGRVVWAALIQANNSMFKPESASCPGEVIYDTAGRLSPEVLKQLAHQLYQLKETTPDQPDQNEYARHITNELTRLYDFPFPASLGNYPDVRISTLWFWRLHLPNGMLSLGYFPLLISDQVDGKVMVLPSRFWPESFRQQWLAAAKAQYGEDYDMQPAIQHAELTGENSIANHPDLEPPLNHLKYLFREESLQQAHLSLLESPRNQMPEQVTEIPDSSQPQARAEALHQRAIQRIEADDITNQQQAINDLQEAVHLGNVSSMLLLSMLFNQGKKVALNQKLGFHYALKAAESGDIGAQMLVSSLYFKGQGIKASQQQGLIWLGKAAAQGDDTARQLLRDYAQQQTGHLTAQKKSKRHTHSQAGFLYWMVGVAVMILLFMWFK